MAEALAAYAAIDHQCARPGIIREVSAPAVAAPPALLITHLLVDLVLAVRHGVRHVVLGYPALGHLVQDVAALHALRALAPQVAPELCDGGTLNLSVTQWSGTAQQVPTSGWAAAAAATMAAGLADATQVVVVPPTADDPQAPDTGLVAGVEFTRQMLDMLADQRLEPSPQLTAECSAIEAEVRAAFASLGSPASQDSPGSPDSLGSLARCRCRWATATSPGPWPTAGCSACPPPPGPAATPSVRSAAWRPARPDGRSGSSPPPCPHLRERTARARPPAPRTAPDHRYDPVYETFHPVGFGHRARASQVARAQGVRRHRRPVAGADPG